MNTVATAPLVSVVVPATRDDRWLAEALSSIRADGYPNLEIIAVWDGPLDRTPELQVDHMVVTGGLGTPAANNAGLAAASGAFVARLDSDDISLPGRFQLQVEALLANPEAELVVGNAVVVDGESLTTGAYPRVEARPLPAALLRSNTLVHSTFMFRASPELRYDERCARMQDYELAMRLAERAPICVVEADLVGYRVHPHQAGRQTTAFRTYIPVILKRRASLARRLGRRKASTQWARDLAWLTVQYVNHRGWRDRYGALVFP